MSQYDVFLSPTASATLGVTNLTGHPAISLKAGFIDNRAGRTDGDGPALRRGHDSARRARLRARHGLAQSESDVDVANGEYENAEC